jgi:endoglucanase
MEEAGYRIIGAARACVLEGTPVPPELAEFKPESYYGSTLHLLTLAYLRERHNGCLIAGRSGSEGSQ